MITPARAIVLMQHRKSIYDSMIESLFIEDRANAEASRLASYAWSQIYNILAAGPPDASFADQVKEIIQVIIDKWKKYCLSGIPSNDTTEAVADFQAGALKFNADRLAALMTPETPDTGKSSKKKKEPLKNLADELTQKVDEEIRAAITPDLINIVIDEITEEALGEKTDFIKMQEDALADAAKVQEAISEPMKI